MSKFHEMMKDILWDVEKLLKDTLQQVTLPTPVTADCNRILEKIGMLQNEYPQLNVDNRLNSQSVAEPSSPPPYLDMKGTTIKKSNTTEYVFSDCTEDHYEVCETDTPVATVADSANENSLTNDQDDSPYDAIGSAPISASELGNAMKSGFLEKKRKGLFSPYQKRWCVVKDGVLFYFARPSDKRQCGQIKLAGYDIRPVISTRDGSRKELNFELTCPGKRSYQFAASTTKDMQDWINAIEKSAVVRCGSVCSSVGTADISIISPPKSDDIPEEDIYEMIEDHQRLSTTPNRNLDFSSSSLQDFDEGQDLYDDADSFLPAVLEAQNAFAEIEVENPEDWYVGQWDCDADEVNEISFKRGDILRIVSKEHNSHSWWTCEINGVSGLVPKNYLMPAYDVVGDRSI